MSELSCLATKEVVATGQEQEVFHQPWVLWYHAKNNRAWDIESFTQIYRIAAVPDFWHVYNNIVNFHDEMFFLMREPVQPMWESPDNKAGGIWSFTVPRQAANNIWLHISMLLVGEYFCSHAGYVNGISIQPKYTNSVIKIWVNTTQAHLFDKIFNVEELAQIIQGSSEGGVTNFDMSTVRFKAHCDAAELKYVWSLFREQNKLADLKTTEDFWRVYNDVKDFTDKFYSLQRQSAQYGGAWTITVSREICQRVWVSLSQLLVNGNLVLPDKMAAITGISIRSKFDRAIIKITAAANVSENFIDLFNIHELKHIFGYEFKFHGIKFVLPTISADTWIFWRHDRQNQDWTEKGYERVGKLEPPYQMNIQISKDHYFVMRDKILPIWEVPENINGGTWSFMVNKKVAVKVWKTLMINIIGGELSGAGASVMNGISISPKGDKCVIKFWIKNHDPLEKIINIDKANELIKPTTISGLKFAPNEKKNE